MNQAMKAAVVKAVTSENGMIDTFEAVPVLADVASLLIDNLEDEDKAQYLELVIAAIRDCVDVGSGYGRK